jgi:hypothetical protein
MKKEIIKIECLKTYYKAIFEDFSHQNYDSVHHEEISTAILNILNFHNCDASNYYQEYSETKVNIHIKNKLVPSKNNGGFFRNVLKMDAMFFLDYDEYFNCKLIENHLGIKNYPKIIYYKDCWLYDYVDNKFNDIFYHNLNGYP